MKGTIHENNGYLGYSNDIFLFMDIHRRPWIILNFNLHNSQKFIDIPFSCIAYL